MTTPVIGDLQSFRSHVVAIPMKELSDGQWAFSKRPSAEQQNTLKKWIKSVLSYDDYGYLKTEEELPDEEKIQEMYENLFRSAASNISYKNHTNFAMVILPGWKGKREREVNFLFGYDEESFKGPPAFGTREYYAPAADIHDAMRRLRQMDESGKDPVKFLHDILSKVEK